MAINNLITIITVVKDNEKTIEKCIKSILSQTYQNLEYIVINENSNESTNEILDKYKNNIDILINEKDAGIWSAMNKGLNLANGKIIGFLNSDDFYYPNTLHLVNKYFTNNKINFLFGTVKKYKLMHGFKPWKVKWSFGFYTSHSVGFFIKTEDHKKIGNYNLKYLSADLDFFYRMIVNFKLTGIATKKDEVFGEFLKGGYSSKINYFDHLIDLNQIRINNNQNVLLVYLLFFFKILKKPIKFFKSLLQKIRT